MKKYLIILCSLCTFLFCVSCSGDDPEEMIPGEENNGNSSTDDDGEPAAPNGDILIVYFSRAGENWQVGTVERGNTAIMGDYIREYTGGAVFEIVPETPYPVDYASMLTVAQNEINNNARPAIRNPLENLDDYSIVFIGSPIWHGVPPMIMRTFFETYPALASKTIVPFGTHGGSGIGSCVNLIREYFPDATLLDSYGISGSSIRNDQSRSDVQAWLQQIGILQSRN